VSHIALPSANLTRFRLRYSLACGFVFGLSWAGVVLQSTFTTFCCNGLCVDVPGWSEFLVMAAAGASPAWSHTKPTSFRKLDPRLQVCHLVSLYAHWWLSVGSFGGLPQVLCCVFAEALLLTHKPDVTVTLRDVMACGLVPARRHSVASPLTDSLLDDSVMSFADLSASSSAGVKPARAAVASLPNLPRQRRASSTHASAGVQPLVESGKAGRRASAGGDLLTLSKSQKSPRDPPIPGIVSPREALRRASVASQAFEAEVLRLSRVASAGATASERRLSRRGPTSLSVAPPVPPAASTAAATTPLSTGRSTPQHSASVSMPPPKVPLEPLVVRAAPLGYLPDVSVKASTEGSRIVLAITKPSANFSKHVVWHHGLSPVEVAARIAMVNDFYQEEHAQLARLLIAECAKVAAHFAGCS
jgi:hypothetical protein